MSSSVTIDQGVEFSSNNGIWIRREAFDWSPERLHKAVQLAVSHLADEVLKNACHGGPGFGRVSYQEYLEIVRETQLEEAARKAKKLHTKNRRRQFDGHRSRLILQMIESGIRHECAEPGCEVCENLTVDHVIPLSRGGTDELTNLRFLCGLHNSQKGDR